MLTMHRGVEGWLAFAGTVDGVRVRRLGDVEDIESSMLEAFVDAIQEAKRITIIPDGSLERRDFHTLSVGGKLLVEYAPVAYCVDVPSSKTVHTVAVSEAAILADPVGNLKAARKEATFVRSRLDELGVRTDVRMGDEATRDALAALMGSVQLLHFGGHGTAAGHDGWQSALTLAEGSRLTVGEILTLKQVPALVVLSGCETSRTSGSGPMAGLGVAHAFVMAGAQQAIATSRPVDDAVARAVIEATYAHVDEADMDLVTALRLAQLDLLKRDGVGAWSSFRALSR